MTESQSHAETLPMTGYVSLARDISRPVLRSFQSVDPTAVLATLEGAGLHRYYPGFRAWFLDKVVPGLARGERRILTAIQDNELAGVAICKRGRLERKLCTLWVSPASRERGLARNLALEAFDWLDTEQPLFTVPEERFAEFVGLVRSWRFATPYLSTDLYRTGKAEYVFNGVVNQPMH